MRRSVEESYRHNSRGREAEMAMGGAHSSENRWTLGFQGVGVETPHRETQRWTTPNQVDRRHQASHGEPLDTKRPRIVEF
ncbi:jg6814 [Pararge aegeria aegeria]|uniref:Jg6814 protein n=1 Tax=Pararge aegeria aegeria TaxID=348720 RepID=A0A8S4QDH7_9NEOP|nr:jg6814 [Pararge aegeria aegeria]